MVDYSNLAFMVEVDVCGASCLLRKVVEDMEWNDGVYIGPTNTIHDAEGKDRTVRGSTLAMA